MPATSAINVEEVVRGLRAREQGIVDRLIDGLHVLSIGRAEAELAGRWRREQAAGGMTLHQADCLIAAAAVTAGAALATGNPKDFALPGLLVQHWPVGE